MTCEILIYVQQDQQDLSVGLNGASVAAEGRPRKWPEQSQVGRDKGESKRRGDRNFKGQPVMRVRDKKQREVEVCPGPRMERRAV